MKKLLIALTAIVLTACTSYSPQRYSSVPDNIPVLKSIDAKGIRVGTFTGPAEFDDSCRGGASITPPVNMTFPGYIQTALADELKVAEMYDDKAPRVTLAGRIERLEFSSSMGLTNGIWLIGLRVRSTNGKDLSVSERYEFESGFEGTSACRRTAEAFLPAVQNLVAKLVNSPEFGALLR